MSAKNGFGRSIEMAKLARLQLIEAKIQNGKGEYRRAIVQLTGAVENLLLAHNNAVRAVYFPRRGR